MNIAQAWQSASSIIMLGPQEQYYGQYHGTLADCQLDGLRIGATFIELTVSANSQGGHYMFALDDFTLINVW